MLRNRKSKSLPRKPFFFSVFFKDGLLLILKGSKGKD
jgi:hypothetical protein